MKTFLLEALKILLTLLLCVSVLSGLKSCEEMDEDINTPIEDFYGH